METMELGDYEALIKKLPNKSVDLIVTDPPYNFEAFGGGFYDLKQKSARTYLKTLSDLKCNDFNPAIFLKEANRVLKQFNAVIFCNKFLIDVYIKYARDNSYLFDLHTLVKSNPIPAKNNHFLHDTEYIVVIKEKGSYFNNKLEVNNYKKFFITKVQIDTLHPAQKPLRLIEKYVKVLSERGGVVLDAFMGSGTTGVACKHLGRSFIGYELDEKYYYMAKNRILQAEIEQTRIQQALTII